jgi:hypothetical protein
MNGELGVVDAEYRFGKPKVYLTPMEIARLMIVRSRLGDTNAERSAEHISFLSAEQPPTDLPCGPGLKYGPPGSPR